MFFSFLILLLHIVSLGPGTALHPFSSHSNCFGSAKSILFDLINVLSITGRLFAEL